ncbi:Acyl carrier protein [Streptomyces xanthophaeus]|uniref:acyl carrier protein n=1 Tax=Streptomyces xanthophaeus TaxID=67385 RepID=UPI00233F7A3E|nr:acyl carrier protein [Streptomyces xanthophaeus]WCD84290.1 Acyl carrier protein [Streptomyces xanthophaeus]
MPEDGSALHGEVASAVGSGDKSDATPEATFSALELDSLAIVELSLALQEVFGVPVGEDELNAEHTIGDTAGIVAAKLGTSASGAGQEEDCGMNPSGAPPRNDRAQRRERPGRRSGQPSPASV